MISNVKQDLQFGLRTLKKNPIFSLMAVLTIAIGIASNVVVFTLVERILLSSLPYEDADRLVRIIQSYPEQGLDTWGLSQATFARYRDQNRSFDAIAAYTTTGVTLTGSDKAEYLRAARVTADFFKVFGVNPVVGRTFEHGEDSPGKTNVVVLSNSLWQRRFGGDPRVVGQSLVINDTSTQIVGVMPANFRFPVPEIELWTPMALNPQATHPFTFTGVARLKQGVAPSAAEAATTSVLRNAANENPDMVSRKSPPPPGAGLKTIVMPLKEALVGKIERPLLMLQIAVALVLLIACANVANLLLSRATRRTHEIALRLALGASPGRVIRQLLTESLLLATIGGIAGIAFAWWCVRALSRAYAQAIPRIEEASISRTVLIAAILMTGITGVLFGLIPALRTYWLGLKGGIGEGQRTSAGYSNRRLNSALVVMQLSLSLVLLIGAGLLLRSFQRLMSVNPGFETQNVLTMILPVSQKKYPSKPESLSFYKKLLTEVRSLPGVKGAGVTSNIPFSGFSNSDGHIVEGQEPQGSAEPPQAQMKVVSPGFFQAMGMTIKQGRDFLESDTEEAQQVAIVDETLAKRYWPNGDAIGKRIRTLDPEWYTIVGVVSAIKDQTLAAEPNPHFYLTYGQRFFSYGQGSQRRFYLAVNSNNPEAITPMIRDRVRGLDPDVPIYSVSTMGEVISKRLDSQRLTQWLLSAFTVIALVLAAIGTYGVMSVSVSSRISELAIRSALGATPGRLLGSVSKYGLMLAAGGTVLAC